MPRLFFALSIPEAAHDDLDDLCEEVPDCRWTHDYHVTLAFLGDVHQHEVRDIIEAGQSIRFPRIELSFQGVGVFPLRGEPRVLWAGLEKNDELMTMQKTLVAELRRAGLEVDQRKFTPHVTLGRLKMAPREKVADWIGAHLGFQSGPYYTRQFELFSSILRPGGSEYRNERTFRALGSSR